MKDKIIKKWELILQKDSEKDITYSRNVLIEMLNDFKQEQESKEPQGAEEWLKPYIHNACEVNPFLHVVTVLDALKTMEQYHNSKRREELIKFAKEMLRKNIIFPDDKYIAEYLSKP